MKKSPKLQSAMIVFLATIIGLGTYLYLSSISNDNAAGQDEVGVYVAVSDIPAGTSFSSMLQNSNIALKSFPAASITSEVMKSSSEISTNEVTGSEIHQGQLILRQMFSPAKTFASGLQIPKGNLAISISVDEVARVANFVVPGSRVVIFSTGNDNKRGETLTKVLVQNALVLAIGPQVNVPQTGSQVSSSPLVTLAVSPTQADLLIHAGQTSKLSLALAHGNAPSSIQLPQIPVSNSAVFGGN